MHEGNPGPAPTPPRFPVHEERTLSLEVGEGLLDVDHGIGDVMKPLPSALQEPTHRRVGSEGGQELDEGTTDRQHGLFHTLLLDDLPVHGRHPVTAAVVSQRLVEVVDSDGHMVEVEELHPDSVARWPTAGPIG